MTTRAAATAAALALCLGGCKKDAPPEAAPVEAAKPVVAAKPAAPATDLGASTPSQRGQSDRECVGAIDTAVPKQLTIAGRKAELNGYKLTFLDKDADDETTFGVLGNIDEATPNNLFDLKRYLEWFKSQKAEAILIDGDTGDSEEQIERSLNLVAESGLPVFVEIGNHECKSDYNDALIAVQKAHDNVVDLGKVRYVDWDDADLLALPGYHDPQYVHCTNGPCIYTKNDVDELKAVALAANDPVILVVHGPPHGTSPQALDVIQGGGHIGDPNLNTLITEGKIPFGVFANVKESAGHATDLTGDNSIKEGQLASPLYLNPGPADSEPWTLNDGTTSTGMAALLHIKGKQASYQIYRAKKLTDAEKAEAAKSFAVKAPEAAEDKPAAK